MYISDHLFTLLLVLEILPGLSLLRDLCEQQQQECAKAVCCEGEFELVDKYKHLEVPYSKWIGMSPEQRKQLVDKVNKTSFGQKVASPSPFQ